MVIQKITPFLWFADQAEEAANYYCGIFPQSKVLAVTRYGEAGKEHHRRKPGSAMTVEFELDGQRFSAINGGPVFQFNPAVSFVVRCETQEEVDHYWDKLGAGGDESAQQCGWLKDKFGLSWQIVPSVLIEMVQGTEPEKTNRMMAALMKMKKLVIADLEKAYAG